MPEPSPHSENIRRAHPLVALLIESAPANARVIEIGAGRGRNTRALREKFLVHPIDDRHVLSSVSDAAPFDAALSTHAFLHGTRDDVEGMVRTVAGALRPGGLLFATFASKRDARFGKGEHVGADAYAPESGDELGVTHVYFDERGVRALLQPYFSIDELTERNVDDVVGRWAHSDSPSGTVHWFVRARKR